MMDMFGMYLIRPGHYNKSSVTVLDLKKVSAWRMPFSFIETTIVRFVLNLFIDFLVIFVLYSTYCNKIMRKSLRIVSLGILLFSFGQMTWSQKVEDDLLFKTANSFMKEYFPDGIRTIAQIRTTQDEDHILMYILDLKPEGWILISADQKAEPIIGFSFENKFDIPKKNPLDPRYNWLQHYNAQIKYAVNDEDLSIHNGWKQIAQDHYSRKSKKSGVTVNKLIKVTWGQGYGWNRYCPEDKDGPGGHTYVGCVAVAMAQAMGFLYPLV